MVDFAAKLAEIRAKKAVVPAVQVVSPAPLPLVVPAIVPVIVTADGIAKQMNEKNNVPSKLGFELREKVLSLEQALLERHPRMPVLLREIHTVLRAQPENVTLFSEDEIAILVSGLKIQTGVEFAASATKGSGAKSATAKIKSLGTGAF